MGGDGDRSIRGLINVLLLAAILGVVLHTQYCVNEEGAASDKEEEEVRLIFNSMLTVCTLAWPILWDFTIGLDKLIERPRLLAGFLWVPCMNLCQMQFVTQPSGEIGKDGRAMAVFQQRSLGEDSAQLISTAFAMGSLLFSSTKNYSATHIIMYGLVLLLAFVIPTLHVPPETRTAVLWRSAQFAVLNYAIGFVISGIASDLFQTFDNDRENGGQGGEDVPVVKVETVYPGKPVGEKLNGGKMGTAGAKTCAAGGGNSSYKQQTSTNTNTTATSTTLAFEDLPRLADAFQL